MLLQNALQAIQIGQRYTKPIPNLYHDYTHPKVTPR